MAEEKKKGFIKSLFTDNDFDGDISKVIGFGLIVVGVVAHFLSKDATTNKWFVTTGACLILGKSTVETLGA